MKKRVVILMILIALILAGIVADAYYIYVYATKCDTKECFDDAIVECKRANYNSPTADATTKYKILGKRGDKCETYVEILQINKGGAELASLQGKSMKCFSDLGLLIMPEKNLKECHGLLKEEIQEVIIKRMHTQIVENIGKISEETTKIL